MKYILVSIILIIALILFYKSIEYFCKEVKKSKETTRNKYKYKIIYKNKAVTEGILEVKNMDVVYKCLMKGNFCQFSNKTKAFYWNINEIQEISVEKVDDK